MLVVRPLRLRVLRPGASAADAVWAGDEHPAAGHFAVRDGDGAVIAVATVVPEPHPIAPAPGDWRVRGMATAPEQRGRGLGAALIAACLEHARGQGAAHIWLHARVDAVPLYARAGFVAESDVFEVTGIGPHVRMARHAA